MRDEKSGIKLATITVITAGLFPAVMIQELHLDIPKIAQLTHWPHSAVMLNHSLAL